jgi:hypothetical protein
LCQDLPVFWFQLWLFIRRRWKSSISISNLFDFLLNFRNWCRNCANSTLKYLRFVSEFVLIS